MSGLTPADVEAAAAILAWAREFLATENSETNRPHGSQVVCPFVAGSIERNAFRLVFHPEVNGFSVEHVEEILESYIEVFKTIPPFDPQYKSNRCLLVVFTNIDDANLGVLDVAHGLLKTKFANRGLMLGQFHPKCDEQGIWNPRFRPSKSPHPLMAVPSHDSS
jgi:hypothetical protein